MPFWNALAIELLKAVPGVILLALGWLVGQRIIAYWDIRKKRQELDIATANEFHKLYGEFKEVSRLWRSFEFKGNQKVPFPESTPFELLKRATAAEGGVEAIIVKLSAERHLTKQDVQILGFFRQAFQKLREAIRDGAPLAWTSGTAEYQFFNELASKTACIISSTRRTKPGRTSESSPPHEVLRAITSVTTGDWEQEIGRMQKKSGKRSVASAKPYFRAGAGAIIINKQGLVLALERKKIANAWQLPQGGMEEPEKPIDTAYREIEEETGIPQKDLELLGSYPHPLVYELPEDKRSVKTGRGQVQHWFLFEFKGTEDAIDIKKGNEFRAWKWMPFSELANSVVEFRKPVYQALAKHFDDHLSKPVPTDKAL